jgi:hypothetical protein
MAQMKRIYMLMKQDRIEGLSTAYNKAVDAGEDSFIFGGESYTTQYASTILNYAHKNPLHFPDSRPNSQGEPEPVDD